MNTEVYDFLGTVRTVWIWIKNFEFFAHLLVLLTKKNTLFELGPLEQAVMDVLKVSVATSPAICPVNYVSANEVIVVIDLSKIAVSFILLQIGNDGSWYPSHFDSISWNKQGSHYLQVKIKLYGLFCAL